jgi:Ran GTPase-activating protein (RanGAP) involved in mRNA processing and transport
MIVFAILGLLIGVFFLFVRQKLSALESRVNLLTDTVQTMAGLNRVEYQDEDDEDEEEEEDEEDEDEEEEEEEVEVKKIELDEPQLEIEDIGLTIEPNEVKTISLEKRVVSDDNVDYESMSLKDLKEKVALVGGPKLRTKKELVDFLNKKE